MPVAADSWSKQVDFRIKKNGEVYWIEFSEDPDWVLMEDGHFRPIAGEELMRQLNDFLHGVG